MRLYVFSAEWCPGCQHVKKAKVVEQFKKKNPSVKVKEFDADSEDGERLLEAWRQQEIPAFVFTTDDFKTSSIGDQEEGGEDEEQVADGDVVLAKKAIGSLAELEKLYAKAKNAEED